MGNCLFKQTADAPATSPTGGQGGVATADVQADHKQSSAPEETIVKMDAVKLEETGGGGGLDLGLLFPALTEVTPRPRVEEPFDFQKDGRPVVRIGSWNVLSCCLNKIANPGVREVICMTVLENGFGILALQEIADREVLDKICDELNNPIIPNVKNWKGQRGHWKAVISDTPAGRMYQAPEYNGFIYDTSQGIEVVSSSLIERHRRGAPKQFARRPFMVVFKAKELDFVAVSVHLKATGLQMEDLDRLQEEIGRCPLVLEAIQEQLPGERDIMILGDFNLGPEQEDFDAFRDAGYKNTVDEHTNTNINLRNLKGSRTYDNIWMSKQAQDVFTGQSGVIREGLTHQWIPHDDWFWGGIVADHCPVWAEYFTDHDMDADGDLTAGVKGIKVEE
ncbi:endonuclease/exonuclease/phosphatase family domain-containing protein 1-like [Lingula anatina]|uniref:Endonuclease/exonuclease/phosphatase family domain-containing protein 1-like n=1 Tax=Lingula anatina TaxID=7574 RepID=A0A1S3HCL7_LINAN|nr:endonuclease/exonuclease/phosphatase family domain-containing protein 1-like [Lingula anatina]|eukprot:XP_013383782.1 endonuclease/exonuclease/phosphatase family domain-containing protein 1-like [Lingula anatina]